MALRLLALALLAWTWSARAEGVKLAYRHDLSTSAGVLRASGLTLAWDPFARELYASGYDRARVFNEAGMEVFSLGEDVRLGQVISVAALEDGELVVLGLGPDGPTLTRTTFRGEPLGRVELLGLPKEFARDFSPSRLLYAGGKLHVVDEASMRVVVATPAGDSTAAVDLAARLGLEKRRRDLGLGGFAVAPEGTWVFSVAALFKVYLMAPDGAIRSFGQSGGAPGKFNIVAGVGVDADGHLFVADTLKCAVLVFDAGLRLVGEFGYRGHAPGQLISPTSLAVGGDQVFVSQGGDRGVAVYRIVHE